MEQEITHHLLFKVAKVSNKVTKTSNTTILGERKERAEDICELSHQL